LFGKPATKSDDLVKRLMADNMILIELLTEASEEAGNQRSYATENLIQDLMETHGKFVWMLRSIVEKTSKLSIEDSEQTLIVVPQEIPQEIPLQ